MGANTVSAADLHAVNAK